VSGNRFKGYTRGGYGPHWGDCYNQHWDCRIARLEQILAAKRAKEQWKDFWSVVVKECDPFTTRNEGTVLTESILSNGMALIEGLSGPGVESGDVK